ncbi:Cyclin-L1 [Nowakowskiella sp. JEL0407]|nr:Cyclin-L1 [Nowakowskiella sp. JEL0407]
MAQETTTAAKLSLQNTVVAPDQLINTPSKAAGIDNKLETELRVLGCHIISACGILLRLPQSVIASSQILFQRFYYVTSLLDFGIQDIALACIFLSSKVEDNQRRIRDILLVYECVLVTILDRQNLINDGNKYNQVKDAIYVAEINILAKLGFNVHVQLPHAFMINYLKALELDGDKIVCQMAWNYLNDSVRTSVHVSYQPYTVACAAIYLSCQVNDISLPENPPWWGVFDVSFEDLSTVAEKMRELYDVKLRVELPLTTDELKKYLKKQKP